MLIFITVGLPLASIIFPGIQGSSLRRVWKSDEKPTSWITEGIIAGTENGLFAIPFNSSNHKSISNNDIRGVAFDWNSRKIYWAEERIGILRANLDGTEKETVIRDTDARGLAIEPINGNIYYGSWIKKAIRVCKNDGQKCSTIVGIEGSSGVYDIEINLSKGYLFWSVWGTKIVRANLDGTEQTIEVTKDCVDGIGVDEIQERIYWSSGRCHYPKLIVSSDLNGEDRRRLANVSSEGSDVQVDGDTIYYTSWNTSPGIFFTRKQVNGLLSNFSKKTRYITLYGTKVPNGIENPCGHAYCAHLCVILSYNSYRCVIDDSIASSDYIVSHFVDIDYNVPQTSVEFYTNI